LLVLAEEGKLGQQPARGGDKTVCCPCCLLGFLRGGCICGQVRVFQFVAAPPENPERPESVSELSPDRLFDRVVAAAGRGAQPLLGEQGDAGEPRGIIGQDVGAVRITGDQPGRGGRRLSRLLEQRGPVGRRAAHSLQFPADD
jgi:hypothetical protein